MTHGRHRRSRQIVVQTLNPRRGAPVWALGSIWLGLVFTGLGLVTGDPLLRAMWSWLMR